jgi:hypothetical protein
VSTAASIPYSNRNALKNASTRKPPELTEAEDKCKNIQHGLRATAEPDQVCGTASDLTKAKNERNILRRARSAQVHTQTSAEAKRSVGHTLTHLEVEGEPTSDRNVWEQALSKHATSKYTDPAETDDVKATRIVNLNLRPPE